MVILGPERAEHARLANLAERHTMIIIHHHRPLSYCSAKSLAIVIRAPAEASGLELSGCHWKDCQRHSRFTFYQERNKIVVNHTEIDQLVMAVKGLHQSVASAWTAASVEADRCVRHKAYGVNLLSALLLAVSGLSRRYTRCRYSLTTETQSLSLDCPGCEDKSI